MEPLVIAFGAFIFYLLAYFTYGRWLGRRIFNLSIRHRAPSEEFADGIDYVPTSKGIVFGHHFTSIAGTGPIVGPAVAVIWGWLPALLWVLLGSVFIGAVHDFAALVVSMRNRGQTVGDLAGKYLTPRARFLFLLVLFLSLAIVLAIFGLVIASVFRLYPQSIFPCLLQIPLAIIIGMVIHRRGGKLIGYSIAALATMYLSVWLGDIGWLAEFNLKLAGWSNFTWVTLLLFYSMVASILPVWLLLQPRDYINSLQLLSALFFLVLGLAIAAFFGGAPSTTATESTRPVLELIAPRIESDSLGKQLPLIFPFLFITIACGAVSGFHCLVSSGTSSKQLRCETDARFVGYGAMLTEGFLAVMVILACTAGLGLGINQITQDAGQIGFSQQQIFGQEAFESRYASWSSLGGLGAKVGAFVDGSANFLKAIGLPAQFTVALMGVLVASFAATTLDTACRLQRYVIQELAITSRFLTPLSNPYGASIFAILTAGLLAAAPPTGQDWSLANAGAGGLILWPLFGATNQLIGGLAFLVIFFWLKRSKRPTWFVIFPAIFMLILPAWAMLYQIFIAALGSDQSWLQQKNYLLVAIGIATLMLEVYLIFEAIKAWRNLQKCQEALEA